MSCPLKGRAHPEGRGIMKCPAPRAPEKLRINSLGLLFFKNNPICFRPVLKNELFSHLEVQNMLKIHAKILSLNIFLKIFFLT